jgi:hypothetical protein
MASHTSALLRQVQVAHQFDYDSLLRYASVHVPGFPSSAPSSFTVKQVSTQLLNFYQSFFFSFMILCVRF